jgi:hypothetical protein
LDSQGTILDYASPRKRQRFRLPARSTLDIHCDRDEIVITETLQGRDSAAGAILFFIFAFSCMAGVLTIDSGFRKTDPFILGFLACLAISGFVVLLMVVQQTWRKTLLTVRYNEMLLAFTSVFYRKFHRWAGDDIADVLLVETANTETRHVLAELLITRCVGGDIHLFTDHLATELKPLAQALPAMLRRGEPFAAPAPALAPAG